MFNKIAFIHYCTQDLNKALDFYRDVLGFKLLVQNEEWVEFEIGDQRLAIRLVDPWEVNTDSLHQNRAMIWLEAQPIERLIKNLRNRKVKFIMDLEIFPYGKTAIIEDLDGNPIGLYEPPSKK